MAQDTNSVTLVGRITKDLELRNTTSGTNVLGFTLANNGRNDQVSYIDCVAFNKSAELIDQYCSKGSQLAVSGRLQQRSYDAKDGSKRYVTEVIVNDFQFLGGKSDSDKPMTQAQALNGGRDVAVEHIDDEPIDLSEIPF